MTDRTALMAGKKGLVMGVANDRSIAWGIARALADHGAELAFTYQVDALRKRVEPLARSVGSKLVMKCDVSDEDGLDSVFETLEGEWGEIDFAVHAVAFSDRAQLVGRYADTTRDNFTQTMIVSCFSFTELARRAARLMPNGGSLVTLSYLGAERVVPHYNVMGVAKAALEASVRYLAVDLGPKGIRVNAISAGPIKTLAASGIGDFRYILKWNQFNSPLHRNVTTGEVGNAAVYLLSDLGTAVSGEVHHVDCGYHVVGMLAVDAIPEATELLRGFKSQKEV